MLYHLIMIALFVQTFFNLNVYSLVSIVQVVVFVRSSSVCSFKFVLVSHLVVLMLKMVLTLSNLNETTSPMAGPFKQEEIEKMGFVFPWINNFS